MSPRRTVPLSTPRLWWITFLTCCALTLSPVVTAFGEETTDLPADETIVLAVTPTEDVSALDPAPEVSAPADDLAPEEDASGAETTTGEPIDAGELPDTEPDTATDDGGEAAGVGDSVEDPATAPDTDTGDIVTGGDEALAGDAPEATEPETGTEDTLAAPDTAADAGSADTAADVPAEEPVQQPQELPALVDAEPQQSLQLMTVDEAGLEGEAAAAIETLEDSGEISTLASALVPVYDTPENVVAVLVGSGVTFSNVGYTGSTLALGTFTGGTGIIGFEDGIILGSGNIMDVVGPNDDSSTSTNLGQPGDTDLSTIVASETYDATVLTFDFVPSGNQIVFSYVFSSEEYNEYVDAGVNDVFAFYVNGQNCATIGDAFVSIDTINTEDNADYFVDNEDGALNTEMDGLTVVLTCTATVNPGVQNTMKLAIADTGDSVYDSNVFIQAKSFVVPTPTPSPSPSPSTTPVTPEPSQTPVTPDATPTQVPGTPTPKPTEHAGKPHKPHKHYTSYKQYVDESADPVPAVALAVTSSSGGAVVALPNTGSGSEDDAASNVLMIAAAIGAAISLVGAIRTSRGQRLT